MKILIHSLLIFLMFRSVSAVANTTFFEIEVKFNNKTCSSTGFNVVEMNNSSRTNSKLFEWMNTRPNAKFMQCVIEAYRVKCYCEKTNEHRCDYNEVMNTVYMIPRDKTNSTPPLSVAKSNKYALKNVNCALTALYRSVEYSRRLYNEHNTSQPLSSSEVLGYEFCTDPMQRTQKIRRPIDLTSSALKKIPDRSNVGIRIDTENCTVFYCRGAVCPGIEETHHLMIKEKILQQFTLPKVLYECRLTGSKCLLANVRRNILPFHYLAVLEDINTFPRLLERRVNLKTLSKREKWSVPQKELNVWDGGSILSWIISILLLFVILLTVQLTALYGYVEERKPLKPEFFKLRDVEKLLTKAFKKGNKEQSSLSLQGAIDWQAAKKAEKKRQKAQKGRVFRSQALKSAKDESDIGSFKKKPGRRASLQQTQNETFVVHVPENSFIPRTPPSISRSLQRTQMEEMSDMGNKMLSNPPPRPVQVASRRKVRVPRGQQPSSHTSAEGTFVYPTRSDEPTKQKIEIGSFEKMEEIKAKRRSEELLRKKMTDNLKKKIKSEPSAVTPPSKDPPPKSRTPLKSTSNQQKPPK